MSNPAYKSLNALMRHMRSSAGIDVRGSAHKRALAHMGYFHGYKGYRFSGSPARRVPYSGFDDLSAVVSFDSGLKALFYPLLMKLEMTMKNLALAAGPRHAQDVRGSGIAKLSRAAGIAALTRSCHV